MIWTEWPLAPSAHEWSTTPKPLLEQKKNRMEFKKLKREEWNFIHSQPLHEYLPNRFPLMRLTNCHSIPTELFKGRTLPKPRWRKKCKALFESRSPEMSLNPLGKWGCHVKHQRQRWFRDLSHFPFIHSNFIPFHLVSVTLSTECSTHKCLAYFNESSRFAPNKHQLHSLVNCCVCAMRFAKKSLSTSPPPPAPPPPFTPMFPYSRWSSSSSLLPPLLLVFP